MQPRNLSIRDHRGRGQRWRGNMGSLFTSLQAVMPCNISDLYRVFNFVSERKLYRFKSTIWMQKMDSNNKSGSELCWWHSFTFWLFPLEAGTLNRLPPSNLFLCIHFPHSTFLHILFHVWSSSIPFMASLPYFMHIVFKTFAVHVLVFHCRVVISFIL